MVGMFVGDGLGALLDGVGPAYVRDEASIAFSVLLAVAAGLWLRSDRAPAGHPAPA